MANNVTTTSTANAASAIITCNCDSAFQDAEYGKGRRVATLKLKDKSGQTAKCTVCGITKQLSLTTK
jgi:hypothetical protein